MRTHRWSVVAAWAVAAVAAVAVVAAVPRPLAPMTLVLVLALSVVVSFALQLVVADRVGLVSRLTSSACGCALVVGAVGVVAALV